MPNAVQDLVTVVLVVGAAGLVVWLWPRNLPGPTELAGLKAISLFAIGPALAVYHLAAGNLGLLVAKSDNELPIVGLWTLFGALAGLREFWRVRETGSSNLREQLESIFSTLMLPVGLFLLWREVSLGAAWAAVAMSGAIVLTVRSLGSGGQAPGRDGISLTAAWITIGMLLQTAIIFSYFTFSGHPALLVVAVALLIVGAWLTGTAWPAAPLWTPPALRFGAVAVPIIIAVVSGIALLRYDEADAGPPSGSELTVMTYNIQLGFSRDNYWSLEKTAQTIEAENPDIVILQEVSRGWVIASGVDQVQWLSQRLDMQIVFGGASRDGLWGNAILVKAPILSQSETSFSTTVNLQRGMVSVQIATQAGELWIFGTHLDNPDDAADVRLQQVEELLAEWNGRTPAILAGDFNATPDSDVLAALTQAGFVDTGASLPTDAFTSENGRRIDYVMVAGPITTRDVRIPDVWTSDHKPVVAEVTVGV
jgi:endonuclease/exonuclease/phosphatase family metal-dependent hydrolase